MRKPEKKKNTITKFLVFIIAMILVISAIVSVRSTLTIFSSENNNREALNEAEAQVENEVVPESNEVSESKNIVEESEKKSEISEEASGEIKKENSIDTQKQKELQEENLGNSIEVKENNQSADTANGLENSSESLEDELNDTPNELPQDEIVGEPVGLSEVTGDIQTSAKGNIISYNAKIGIPTGLAENNNYTLEISAGQYYQDLKYSPYFDKSKLSIKIGETQLASGTDYNIQEKSISVGEYTSQNVITFTEAGKRKIIASGLQEIDITYGLISNGTPIPYEKLPNDSSGSAFYTLVSEISAKLDNNVSITLKGEDIALCGINIYAYINSSSVSSFYVDYDFEDIYLAGVEFKVALTRDDATNNRFIKNSSGEDIVLTSGLYNEKPPYASKRYFSERLFGLTEGTYYIVEVKTPKGYVKTDTINEVRLSKTSYLPPESYRQDASLGNSFRHIELVTDVKIQLQDSKTGSGIASAKFKLQVKNELDNYVDVGYTKTTDSSGNIIWTGVKPGQYRIVKLRTIKGAELIEKTVMIEVYEKSADELGIKILKESGESEEVDGTIIIKYNANEESFDINISQAYAEANKIGYKTLVEIPKNINEIAEFMILYSNSNAKFLDSTLKLSGNNVELQKNIDYRAQYSSYNRALTIILNAEGKNKLKNVYSSGDGTKKYLTVEVTAITYNNTEKKISNTVCAISDDVATSEKSVETAVGSARFKKVNSEYYPLAGARFKIALSIDDIKEGNYIKDFDGEDLTLVSDNGSSYGSFFVGGLAYGTYYLVEIEAPSNKFVRMKKPLEFTIDENSYNNQIQVVNNPNENPKLPEAGGMGVIITTVVGSLLIIMALKMKNRNVVTTAAKVKKTQKTKNQKVSKMSKIEKRNSRRISDLKEAGKLKSKSGRKRKQ